MISSDTLASRVVRFAGLGIWLLITLFPLYWILITSFKPPGEVFSYPLRYWPSVFSIDSYIKLFQGDPGFSVYIMNSLIAAVVSGIVATAIACFSGYVLARFTFNGKGALIGAFLVTQMVPGFIALGPLYMLMSSLDLVDNRWGLILIYIASSIPFLSIMLRGFFANIPETLEEAAMIDGCSRTRALIQIVIPVMRPGIIAAFIFSFVNVWNELFLAVILMNSDENRTIPSALNSFIGRVAIDWSSLSAAAVVSIIPTMVLFAISSRYIIQGLTSGAVKG